MFWSYGALCCGLYCRGWNHQLGERIRAAECVTHHALEAESPDTGLQASLSTHSLSPVLPSRAVAGQLLLSQGALYRACTHSADGRTISVELTQQSRSDADQPAGTAAASVREFGCWFTFDAEGFITQLKIFG